MSGAGGPGDPPSFSFDDDLPEPPSRRLSEDAPAPDAASAGDELDLDGDDAHAEHPPPEPPRGDSRLTQAREAREVAEAVSRDAYRSLWIDVLRWPLRSSPRLTVVFLAVLAALLAYLDGGGTQDARVFGRVGQVFVGAVTVGLLAIVARRTLRGAIQGDRRVVWRPDDDDVVPWYRVITEFITVIAITMLPLAVYLLAVLFVDVPAWADRIARPALCLLGAAQIPLALVASTVKDTPFAALPHVVRRVWRAEPHAARVAGVTSVACVALLLLSFAFAGGFAPVDPKVVLDDHTPLRTAGRVGLFALRFLALYAALVSFRVAGLLVHEVPEVRESLR